MKDDYGQLISSLAQVNDKKIVMLVLDGLGDTDNDGKGTALQMARTETRGGKGAVPHTLTRCARSSAR